MRCAIILCEVAAQRGRASGVAVMNNKTCHAQIHQGKRHRMPGATSADLNDGCSLRVVPAEAFLETATPSAPVKIVPRCTAVRRDPNGVDRADLGGLWIHRIKEREDFLLERISDVCPGKSGGFDR